LWHFLGKTIAKFAMNLQHNSHIVTLSHIIENGLLTTE